MWLFYPVWRTTLQEHKYPIQIYGLLGENYMPLFKYQNRKIKQKSNYNLIIINIIIRVIILEYNTIPFIIQNLFYIVPHVRKLLNLIIIR